MRSLSRLQIEDQVRQLSKEGGGGGGGTLIRK